MNKWHVGNFMIGGVIMIRFDGKSEGDNLLYALAPINSCIEYSQGALFQGKRLMSAIRSKHLHSLIKLEEEFFIFALDRAIFHLKELENLYTEFCPILAKIDKEVGLSHIKDVRDMRTHSDEYRKGKGRAKSRLFVSPQNLPIKPNIDAMSSIMFNDLYLIGGRVDFYKTMELLEATSPEIEKISNAKRLELLQKDRTK